MVAQGTAPAGEEVTSTPASTVGSRFSGSRWRAGAGLGLVLVVLLIFPHVLATPFWWNVGILAMIFATAGLAWNVLGGYAGQISFGNALFFGAGAYSTVVLVRAGWSPWLTFPVGAAIAAVLGVLIGIPCFRLRTHYFAIATIAVAEIADVVVNSNSSLGASSGLNIPIKPYGLATLQFSVLNPTPYYYAALILFGLAALWVWVLVRGRTGAYLRAVRDSEPAASASGVHAWRMKLLAVAVSAIITAVAGGLYAMYGLFVDPSLVLDLSVSIDIVLVAVLGGAATLFGPLIGGWLLIALQQYTRQEFSSSTSGLDLLIFGVLIVLIVLVEPGGLSVLLGRGWTWGDAKVQRFRQARQAASGAKEAP